jgi:hypothetical protein
MEVEVYSFNSHYVGARFIVLSVVGYISTKQQERDKSGLYGVY